MEFFDYHESFVRNHMEFVSKEVNIEMEAFEGHPHESPTAKESSTQAILRKNPIQATWRDTHQMEMTMYI